jgi:hypothetical protein
MATFILRYKISHKELYCCINKTFSASMITATSIHAYIIPLSAPIHTYLLRYTTDTQQVPGLEINTAAYTRWFKYDWDCLCVNKSQFVPVIFEPPCNSTSNSQPEM